MSTHADISYCQRCGAPTQQRIPADDNRPRAVCSACGFVHYQNPLVVAGTLPYLGQRVLLCRRAIEPRYGLWTLPAGFLELHESSAMGALRETDEEAGVQIELGGLLALVNVPKVSQLHVFYRARLLNETTNPGAETLETQLFAPHDIPWETIAFHSITLTLRAWLSDCEAGVERMHELTVP